MTCSGCGHPVQWHGDRAVAACDGGWSSVTALRRHVPERMDGHRPVSICGCTGWRVDPS